MSSCELCDSETGSRYLCSRHAINLAESLAELPDLYSEVGACLVPRNSSWGQLVTTRASAGPRSPINEDILDTVNWGRAAEVMRLWRTDIRRVRWPHRGDPPPGSLAEDCRWLAMELDWIVSNYPAAGDLAREAWGLELQARSIVGDPKPRTQRLGPCVAVTDDQGTVCGAILTRLPNEAVACRWCGTQYRTERDLLLLLHYQPKESA
ncbi:hypothetical protein [Streptomyces soliscabiei]|uniref:hypothetical protein n=1 Tax=Streptomyces soliscabiei TaxID=588897 RepID=UPI0029BA88EB|nr:hypothetical protein [Streptomyces sp. NY05-11A]MDX2679272.1 hypothetical protein [Streptomyces sp. NY05-11A]